MQLGKAYWFDDCWEVVARAILLVCHFHIAKRFRNATVGNSPVINGAWCVPHVFIACPKVLGSWSTSWFLVVRPMQPWPGNMLFACGRRGGQRSANQQATARSRSGIQQQEPQRTNMAATNTTSGKHRKQRTQRQQQIFKHTIGSSHSKHGRIHICSKQVRSQWQQQARLHHPRGQTNNYRTRPLH